MYRGTDFQSTNIEKHPSHKYLLVLKLFKQKFPFNYANNHNLVLIID